MTREQDRQALYDLLETWDGSGKLISVDTETSGLYVDEGARVSAVSVGWLDSRNRIRSYAWPFDHGQLDKPGLSTPSLFDSVEDETNLSRAEWSMLMKWIARQRVVMHNAKFDLLMIYAGLRRYRGTGVDLLLSVWWDTQNAQWVLEPEERSSLKPTAARLWGESEADEQAALKPYLSTNGNRFDLVPWEIMQPYAAKDAELTLRLYLHQMSILEEGEGVGSLEEQCEMELQVMGVLTKMAYRGIGYDVEQSRIESAKAKRLLLQLQQALPFKPTPAGARGYFFKQMGAMPHCVTEKSGPSVSECCVRSLILQGTPHAREFAQLQKVVHAIGKYYDGYADACGEDGRLRTDYWQAGTSTMRFASRRVNLQAIPQDFRMEVLTDAGIVAPKSLFKPRRGYELWEFDLAQAEVRVAAKVAGCKTWLDMFNSEEVRDLHSETSIQLFGDYEYEHRQMAKRANFSLIYGVGARTFKQDTEKITGLILSEGEAKRLVDTWRGLYPEFGKAARKTEKVAERQGYVTLLDGRRRYFTALEKMQDLHKAFNAVIQGSIAQFVKRWMIDVEATHECVILQIHDSIVVEIPAKRAKAICDDIIERGSAMATEFFGVTMQAEAKQWKSDADAKTNAVVA
jgi:DNA polymerase I-like protein with 3'-5' exonuclease and polymerase domains